MKAVSQTKPTVSIGLPVYNGSGQIENAIETILDQSYADFELIISDNASTDDTAEICKKYAQKDSRIRFFHHATNMGAVKNYEFALNEAVGEFFMWAPAHYRRSNNYIEECLSVLQASPECAFASTPNCWVGDEGRVDKHKVFSLKGTLYQRIDQFLDNCWDAHACFYALFRREHMVNHPEFYEHYLAYDWIVMLHLVFKGAFLRPENGLLIVGKGASSRPDHVSSMRTSPIHYLLPLYDFSKRAAPMIMRSNALGAFEKLVLVLRIFWLNMTVQVRQFRNWLSKTVKALLGKRANVRER